MMRNIPTQMIMQKNIRLAKTKTLLGSTVWVFLLALLVFSLAFPSSSNGQSTSTEIVTGSETSSNYLPQMDQFSTSGGTFHNQGTGTSKGCLSGNFCTAGKQGPGGTYSSTFDLEDNMTIDQINRGFDMDYGMDVTSHVSNSRLASCINGNTLQNADCRDIVTLTVKLFDGTTEKHSFQHALELDYTGSRNFSFSQTIPQNNYSSLTGTFDMFGIDAGFGSKFFGPAFDAPFLTTTFDLVTLIETEVIDVINTTDIIETNLPEDTSMDDITAINVEVEGPDGDQMASLELEVQTEMTLEIPTELAPPTDMGGGGTTPEPEVTVEEVSTEIEAEIEVAEVAPEPQPEPEPEPTESNNTEPEPEPEQTANENSQEENTDDQQSEETQNEEPQPEESNSDAGSDRVADSNQDESSNEETTENKSPQKKVVAKKSAKQKAAKKIIKKMGDKGRYDSTNQLKTLVIMNVLTDTKKFLVQPTIPQPQGFFTNKRIPDAQLPENNRAAWMLMGGSNQLHDALTGLQYK